MPLLAQIINGYCYRTGGRRCSGGNLIKCAFIYLLIDLFIDFFYLFVYLFTLVPNALEPSKSPLKGRLSATPLFCLHTRVWLLYFIGNISKQKKIPVKLLKIHTFRDILSGTQLKQKDSASPCNINNFNGI